MGEQAKFIVHKNIIYGACCNKTRQSEHSVMWHKWEADDDVAVKLTNVTDDVLKSNNGTHSLVMDLLILMLTLLYQKVRNINYNRINIGLPLYKNNIYEINLH